MPEALAGEIDALLTARERARGQFLESVAEAVAADRAAIEAYADARTAAIADPGNDALWQAAAQARQAASNAAAVTATVVSQAVSDRDAAIVAAARTFAAAVPQAQ